MDPTTDEHIHGIGPAGLAVEAARPTRGPVAWLWRYLPAELLSLSATLLASWTALTLTDNLLIAAIAGTWAENAAYYGTMVVRELWGRQLTPLAVLRVFRDLLLEFGPAELLDSFLIRPASLAAGMSLAPSPLVGAVAGKLVAALCFYLPTIISYELLQRRRTSSTEIAP
jgi:hypothetical protein